MTIPSDKKIRENMQKNIIFYRKMRNLTQKELAEKIGTGITTVSGWERGLYSPDIDTLFLICNVLGVSLNDICGVTDDGITMSNIEMHLLNIYKTLNSDGQRKLVERAEELIDLGYVKEDGAKMA